MALNSEIFLSSFNRVEDYLKELLAVGNSMGFSEVVRRLSRKKDSRIWEYQDDLLQLAQLRNAIIHEKKAENFVIAEPNQWAVDKMLEIEQEILAPEKVLPRFKKHVVGFEENLSLVELLKEVANHRFSQFPIYKKGKFLGLITIRGLGLWVAVMSQKGPLTFEHKTAKDILDFNSKKPNFCFCSEKTAISDVKSWFEKEPTLEAVLITKKGLTDGNLLGIIRPRDLAFEKGE